MKFWNAIKLVTTACPAMFGMSMASVHADESLNDLAGRIEYAFYAADSRSLLQSLQAMETLQVAVADRATYDSYLNYGRWKLAQLLATDTPGKAQQLVQTCAESQATTQNDGALAMHQAIVAACLATLERLRSLRGMLYRRDREAAMAQALRLGGKMAQVRLVAAWLDADRYGAAQAQSAIKRAVEQYSSAADAGSPAGHSGWGHAEACYLLGKAEFARGNVLAARNALEQALVLAPEYRDAQQLLQSLNLQ